MRSFEVIANRDQAKSFESQRTRICNTGPDNILLRKCRDTYLIVENVSFMNVSAFSTGGTEMKSGTSKCTGTV